MFCFFHQNTQKIQESPFPETRTYSAVIDIFYIEFKSYPDYTKQIPGWKNGEKLPVTDLKH